MPKQKVALKSALKWPQQVSLKWAKLVNVMEWSKDQISSFVKLVELLLWVSPTQK